MPNILVISNYRSFHSTRPEAEIFIGLQQKGVNVSVMTHEDAEYLPRFRKAGVQVIPFHPTKKLDRSEIAFIRETITGQKIDVLFLFNSKAIINGIQAARGTGVKVVLYRGYAGNVHWYDPFAYLKYLHPRVDKIICNSKGVEEHINVALFWAPHKTVTINKGHNTKWYENIDSHPRSKFPCAADAFILTCVANDRTMKGIQYLLKSTYYWPEDQNLHLLLIGKGMDKAKYLRLLENSPNKHKVHLMGFRKDALSFVASSDAFVLSSIKGESITKSVLEAMSLEVAPVITDIPGNKELVENGISGIVVPPKDPAALAEGVIQLTMNNEFKKRIAKNARERIRTRLSHERTVESYFQLIHELVQE